MSTPSPEDKTVMQESCTICRISCVPSSSIVLPFRKLVLNKDAPEEPTSYDFALDTKEDNMAWNFGLTLMPPMPLTTKAENTASVAPTFWLFIKILAGCW